MKPSPAVMELLRWIAARPRTYAETMEAWKSNCPRLSAWEDALAAGLVCVEAGKTAGDSRVTVTDAGKAAVTGMEGSERPRSQDL